jgi:hypothetical protein
MKQAATFDQKWLPAQERVSPPADVSPRAQTHSYLLENLLPPESVVVASVAQALQGLDGLLNGTAAAEAAM